MTQQQEVMKEWKDVLLEHMRDMLDSEKQLVKAIPKMVEAAHDQDLASALNEHLEQTKGHVQKLEQAFGMLGAEAKGSECKGMKGLISEGEETIKEGKEVERQMADVALIAAAQKVEHYEISGYGTIKTLAQSLGQTGVANILEQIEGEEKKADTLLTDLAGPLLPGREQ
jgi:ferritin-like metal-binding protein YciE